MTVSPGPSVLNGTRYLIEGAGASAGDDPLAPAAGGVPVVLVHGVGMDLGMWDALAARLQSRRPVIRYDMLGHSGSSKPAGPYRLADFVDQLARLADDLEVAHFNLVGFSMGGLVAQGFALRHADRVGRLVLVNTVFDRSLAERAAITARVDEVRNGGYAASVEAAIDRWFTPAFRSAHSEIVDAVRRHLLGNDLAAYAAAYAVFGTADAELADHVAEIRHPSLVITGAEDQRSTADMARALAARLQHGHVEIIDGQRHLTPLEVPDRLAASIERFLALSSQQSAKAAS